MGDKIKGGYIIRPRKIYSSHMMDKPPLWWKLWDWMLAEAMFSDNGSLKRGQFRTSLAEMQEAMSWKVGFRKNSPTIKELRGALSYFTKVSMAVTTKVTHGMVVTICNYDIYQDISNYEGHDEGHMKGHNKKKECKEKQQDEEDVRLAEWIYERILLIAPSAKKPKFKAWADTIRLMREVDKIDRRKIATVFKWANEDDFWKSNILSVGKLREKFPQLEAKMEHSPKVKSQLDIIKEMGYHC